MQGKLTQGPDRAKEKASPRSSEQGEARELARINGEFPELSWLGEQLLSIARPRLVAADALVRFHGEDPEGPEVARALGISPEQAREKALIVDVQRRAKRPRGAAPAGKSLEERRTHVAVEKLLAFLGRLIVPRPRRDDGERLDGGAAAVLAEAGLIALSGEDCVERHPRALRSQVRLIDRHRQERVDAELAAMELGAFGPGESVTPLPDGICSATMRNRRRARDARAQFDDERRFRLQQRHERLAAKAGGDFRNPAGVKPLPLHEGRMAWKVARDRDRAVQFLTGLPHVQRTRLFEVATRGGLRGRFSEQALLVYAFYAYLLWQSEAPRPAMRRKGFDRAVEGLCREALAVAFVWNRRTEAPYHANTISMLARSLEEAGLISRESPNSVSEAYKGVTGWALYVYRLRNAEQLGELLRALEALYVPSQDGARGPWSRGEAPS